MNSLNTECCRSAEILSKELLALKKISGQGRLRAAGSLLKRKLKAGEIQSLKRRLEENQRTLDTKVLIDVRQTIVTLSERQDDRYTKVCQELTALATKLDTCHISAGDKLKTILNSVVESNKHEHQETRLHFGSTVQALTTSQAQKQEHAMRYERFIESLRFDDMNVRENDVSESHSETFGWVYNDDAKDPWDNLKAWLEHGHSIYWINGKAGSGKSTFMKFLVNDKRTSKALNIWSGEERCTILKFYFWLSGTKLQRSMKGFLCSLLRQIVSTKETVLEDILQNHKTMMTKRSLGDWSLAELRDMLMFAVQSVNSLENMCIFVDGIDEFDQDEDAQQLLDFIKLLADLPKIKLCLSSRPEIQIERFLSQYSKLRLQDLTAKDMESCIKDRLDSMREKYPSVTIKAKDIDRFLHLMTQKADGVFLWVHFALKSLLRGMRNEDDFEVLLDRLNELPSGMEQLYQQMWLRLNGDEQRYHKQASLYFSYQEFFPCSLFEIMVALNGDIQAKYLQEMKPQDPSQLAQDCETLKTRIMTRCAGLLEITKVVRADEFDEDLSSVSSSDSIESPTTQSENMEEETSKQIEEAYRDTLGRSPAPQSTGATSAQASASRSLQQYHDTKIKFLHRTARDFLLDTEAGQQITGQTSQTRDDRLSIMAKARIAALLEGLDSLSQMSIVGSMWCIGAWDLKDEIELLETLRKVCETLHVPGSRNHDITRIRFWGKYSDYVRCAALSGCTKYVQWYLEHATTYISPYYRGLLFCGSFDFPDEVVGEKWLRLAMWLADQGADLNTKHIYPGHITTPFQQFLQKVLQTRLLPTIPETAAQVAQTIERLYPTAIKPKEEFITHMAFSEELQKLFRFHQITVEFEGNFLCRLALECLRCSGVDIKNLESVPIRLSTPVKVMVLHTECGKYEGCLRLTPEDAVYLGQAYEKCFLQEDNPDGCARSFEIFASRLKEVIPRCEEVHPAQWQYEVGRRVDPLDNALTLDPSEDVDESNWRERGYFRTETTNPRHGSVFTVMDRDLE